MILSKMKMELKVVFNISAWSQWKAWSNCSYSCGGGVRQRSRTCTGGNDCEGDIQEVEVCNTQPCSCE